MMTALTLSFTEDNRGRLPVHGKGYGEGFDRYTCVP